MNIAMRFLPTEYSRPKMAANGLGYPGNKSGFPRKGPGPFQGKDNKASRNLCWAFNSGGCMFDTCKYAHICSRCYGSAHSQGSCWGQPFAQKTGNPLQSSSSQA